MPEVSGDNGRQVTGDRDMAPPFRGFVGAMYLSPDTSPLSPDTSLTPCPLIPSIFFNNGHVFATYTVYCAKTGPIYLWVCLFLGKFAHNETLTLSYHHAHK